MRLTLRTLLAYLDDRLTPANARELGQKISASPYARELAQRIKAVVRKRRLASDESSQKTIDANLIAEYLDDQLTPELVALIEKEILSSDHSLAEVAATHQILGLLADPLEVDEKLQKRLYQMDPVAEVEAGGAMTEAEISASEDWKPLAPASVGSKRSPMVLLVLMVFGWLALMFLDQNLYRQSTDQPIAVGDVDQEERGGKLANGNDADAVAQNMAAKKAAGLDSTGGQPSKAGSANGNLIAQADPTEPMSEADQLIAKAQVWKNPLGGNEVLSLKPPVDLPSAKNTMNDAGGQKNSGGPMADSTMPAKQPDSDSTEIAMTDPGAMMPDMKAGSDSNGMKPKGVIPDPMIADTAMEDVSSSFSPHTFVVNDSSGALMLSQLQKQNPSVGDGQQMEWGWASNLEGTNNWNNLLSLRVACVAAPFSATVGCQASGWQIQAVGPSVFQGIDKKYAGLKILHGRYILTRTAAVEREPFLLQVGGRQLLLNPTDIEQRVAISVSPLPTSIESSAFTDVSLFSRSAAVLVTFAAFEGPTTIQLVNAEEVATVTAGSQMVFRSDGSFTSKTAKQPILQWEWVTAATNPIPAAQANLQKALLKKLKVHDSVREAVAAVAEDSNPMIARWAVQIPTAERDVEQLSRLLFDSEQQVVRSEAFYALQDISRTVPNGLSAVVSTLETRLDLNEMQQAMRMIKEISRISLEDRLTSEWLVSMLNSNRLVLREMAISTLDQHLNNRNNYFADDSKSRRERAVRRWNSELGRNDGRLIPPQE